jgi:hypothetical protein
VIPPQINQARRYGTVGLGVAGALLKHSLYPLGYLTRQLPTSGVVVDLGCGEGMLTNLLAGAAPSVRFAGLDRDPERIRIASRVASPNASFQTGDIIDCQIRGGAAVILNDVLHHHPYDYQLNLLASACAVLDDDGLVILKEVDERDTRDVRWTRFWDSRLYPADTLHFRTVDDWHKTLRRFGLRIVDTYRSRHPWPASRTVIVSTKRPKLGRVAPPAAALHETAQEVARVLVTGATGFIGEHLVRELLRSGIDGRRARVTVVARDPWLLASDIRTCPSVDVLDVNLCDIERMAERIQPCEFAFHLAARVDFFAREEIVDANLEPTRKLLAVLSKDRVKRFVYTSTVGAVDRAARDACTTLLDERSPAHPASFYGRSKLEGERLVRESGLPFTIVRIPWCYGPGMSPTHHVRALCERIAAGGLAFKFAWPGRVSIIDVREATRILCAVACDGRAINELYFLTDGQPISFGELLAAMGRLAGRRTGHIKIPAAALAVAVSARRWIPFQLKCLCMDVLAASNAKLVGAGHVPAARGRDFLLPLARYIQLERWPLRHRSRVLITGGAGGIGLALARRCYALGYSLSLIDKNEAALQAAAEQLEADCQVLDLADEAACRRFAEELEVDGDDVDVVVNNAGIGARGEYATLSHERHLDMIRVNCMAPVLINRALMAKLLKRGSGTIVNIASSAGFQPLPYMAVYAASKAFMLSYSEALAGELHRAGNGKVSVITVSPSGTATSFQKTADVKESDGLLDPDYVAARIVGALGQGSHTLVIGMAGRLMSLSARVLSGNARLVVWEYLMRRLR